ncbi:type II/IV secretion system protein [Candidatus Uhrbacteria bacterium]|nr:type II/IV secretion system protein [Candidatus Uhrbacteria bacterium]
MLPIQKLPDILDQAGILNKKDLSKIQEEAECKGLSLEQCIFKKRLVNPPLLYKAAAKFFNLPYIELLGTIIPSAVLNLIPEPIARTHGIIPYAKEGLTVKIAALNPDDLQILDFIEKKLGLALEISLTDPESCEDALKQYKKSLEAEFKEIAKASKKPVEELAKEAPVVRIVDTLLEHAILQGASDIHIEPREKEMLVRFRVDGMLREAMILPKEVQPSIAARVKILANLKIDEHNIPQDGRFKVQIPNYKVSIRVSIFPMFDGEKIVLRILQEGLRLLSINELGFEPDQLKLVARNIQKPHGIILVTGPTGSGKTTTLYAFLAALNKPQVNISTIEDPIEYRIPGINQSQVNPRIGFTFAIGLRALLRQDPNIIMVGEIRDAETADIAINAALTGHLVLSTLHTNDAITAISRLFDLGAPPFLIAQTAALITAQRLVRRICPHCTVSYTLPKEMADELRALFDMEAIAAALERTGVISEAKTPLTEMRFFKGAGCAMCGQIGYRGRVAIHEVLEVTPELSSLIYRRAAADELKKSANKQGMISLLEDAFIKAKRGLTTISEIIRVTKE